MRLFLLIFTFIFTISSGLVAQVGNYAVGDVVSDFTVTDVHGNTHSLSSITASGKWVIIDFFFVACGPCQGTVPFFSELHEKYGCNEGDIFCISIDNGDNNADVLGFEATYSTSSGHSPAPAVSGTEGGGNAVVAAFGIPSYPTYCLIGPDMKLKNGDIWPVNSIVELEAGLTGAGLTATEMSCNSSLVEQEVVENTIKVHPNPAADNATVSLDLEVTSEVVVTIYNSIGEMITVESFNGVIGNNTFILNTSKIENGQYILKVSFGKGSQAQARLSVNN